MRIALVQSRAGADRADNLRRAFPDWDEERVQRTARGVYAHFGTVLFDILWLEGRTREKAADLAAAGVRLDALRLAIEDLAATYPDRYNGAERLAHGFEIRGFGCARRRRPRSRARAARAGGDRAR